MNNSLIVHATEGGTALPMPLTAIRGGEPTERKPFIEANTVPATLSEIRDNHLVPIAFTNEPLISHVDFIQAAWEATAQAFPTERVLGPQIRLSHVLRGRVPEAQHKAASELEEWEKTTFYERCCFILEIPTISDQVGGQNLTLVVGGARAYDLKSLSSRRGADQHFKVAIGFQVRVCSNLTVYSDGFAGDIKVRSVAQLQQAILQLIAGYDAITTLTRLERLTQLSLTERQFAQLIGRMRLYQHMPQHQRQGIQPLQFGDAQINAVARDYYRESSFCREESGDINLWRVLNLLTAANKASYIDSYLDRAANASDLVGDLASALDGRKASWYLS